MTLLGRRAFTLGCVSCALGAASGVIVGLGEGSRVLLALDFFCSGAGAALAFSVWLRERYGAPR